MAKKGKRAPAKRTVQVGLKDVGHLTLLKKPHEQSGKIINVPGSHWGASCANADKNKLFKVTVLDHSLAHRDGEDEDSVPYEAMQLQEMGVDNSGGTSDPFWMRYPMPFLTFYYDTFPDELKKAPVVTPARSEAEQGSPAVFPATEDSTGTGTSIYKYLNFLSSEKVNGRSVSKFTCCIGYPPCGGKVTIFGKSTGPFFKHVRRKTLRGDAAHAPVLEELNEESCRQVQMPNGEFATVWSFEECFPHHVDFMWLVAGGLSLRLNRRPVFRDYVRGFEPRVVLPHNETIHRLASLTDEIQTATNRARRNKHIAAFRGLPCTGLQLDLWTDHNSGIAYAAMHSSQVTEPKISPSVTGSTEANEGDSLVLMNDLLHFKAFPFTAHTGDAIREWFVAVLLTEEIPISSISGVTPDGAADGQSGIKAVPGLLNRVDVCILHDEQRAVLYSVGLAGPKTRCPNQDARDLLRANGRIVQLSHQSREVSDGFREFQAEHTIPASKIISTVRTNATRWTNQQKQVSRNNLMQPIIDPVLRKYRREHSDDTAIIVKDSSDDDSGNELPRGPYTKVSFPVLPVP